MKHRKFCIKNVCRVLVLFITFNVISNINCKACAILGETSISNDVLITNDANKKWKIMFNQKINEKSIKSNIYILDNRNNKIKVNLKLASDKKTVEIQPLKKYEVNKIYRIFINNVKGNEGEKLLKQVIYSFKVEPLKGNIASVKTSVNAMITYFEIKASNRVFKITINNSEMKYEGNNNYTLALQNIVEGKKIIIKAFDSNNKLLEQKEYNFSK